MTDKNRRIHNKVAELLSAYIDGEVVADERALIEAHLATCVLCARDLASLRQTVTLLGQLPQVAARRSFTLRESDVKPVRPIRAAWWQLTWVQGAVAAAAVLLFVVVAGSALLLGPLGLRGMPGAPQPVALQEAPRAGEEPAVAETVLVEVEKEVIVEVEEQVASEGEEAAAAAVAEMPAAEALPAEPVLPEEAPAPSEAAEAESSALADTAVPPMASTLAVTATPPAQATPVAGGADLEKVEPSETLLPTYGVEGTLVPTPESLAMRISQLEVQDLLLKIEPGVIYVSGRLPLPEGQQLQAELWQADQLMANWEMPEDQRVITGADGKFSVRLQTQPDAPDYDLFAIEPATYEIRIRSVDSPELGEARIPFDTFGPPASLEPTNPQEGARQTAPVAMPAPVRARTSAPAIASEVPPAALVVGVPRTITFLVVLGGFVLVAGLAVTVFVLTRR